MKATGRAGQWVLYAAVALLALGWAVGFDVSIGIAPTANLGYYLPLVAFVAVPWLVAVWLLWRARPAGSGTRQPATDGPARLLAAAVATLPGDRRDWGAAMTAELARVQGRSVRWRFAAGCARAALFPPRASRVPVLVAGALAAALTAGLAVGAALPALRVFVVAFVVIVGVPAVVAVARSCRLGPSVSGLAITAVGLVGVAACIAVTGQFLARYPIAALHLQPATALFLAALLAGCVWLTLAPPRWLTTTGRLPRGIAIVAAVALGAGLLVVSRLGLRDVAGLDAGIFGYLFGVPIGVVFAGSLLAAAVRRSFRAGVQAAVWTALLASPVIFAIAVSEAVHWYQLHTSLILAGDSVPLHAVGENLRNFTWGLLLFPLWWLPFGVLGAAVGAAGWRWPRRRLEA
jgi:hypothetical protein